MPLIVVSDSAQSPKKSKSKSKEKMKAKAMRFDIILDGTDLVGRAHTGQGKTMAFVLPILESLMNGPVKTSRKTGYGKPPSVLVLLPTRELTKQVFSDFEVYGGAMGLTSCCLHGGAPGHVKDHIERENIDLSSLTFRVLDEVDEMLRMGFVEDVELILGKVKDTSKVQTLLFSTTLPGWVKGISSRFLKQNKRTIDLVGNEKMKACAPVRHIVIPCTSSARPQLILDIICCYSSGGCTIIFTETKESASQLLGLLPGAWPLHGDIQQAKREVTLAGFRSGKFMILVAMNVRAGNIVVAVMLYDPRRANVSKIKRESGVKFEHISAPQPSDVAQAAGVKAEQSTRQISDSVILAFKSAAEQLLNMSGMSAVELLAKALAKASTGRSIYTPPYSLGVLRRFLPENKVEFVKGLILTVDGNGIVFDVAAEDLDTFLAGQENATNVSLEVVKTLPCLQERDQSRGGRFGSGGGRGGNGGRGGGFSGGRGGTFSGQRNGRFSGGLGGGRGRGNNRR
ncbi:hypothetical protein EUGRSUZ_L00808 [Eucalyptus grandis]|uniref:RNA helicase n=1 Tax=Eucalyptus grandis TaxID=71139 RepID=A0A058ZUM0_EUCGR|nr:hypothetical protein EUGRSUZ_L00808 [Eucalyptus grandis]